MSGPDNFLNRWARRKREVAAEEVRSNSPAAEPAKQLSAPSEAADPAARPPETPPAFDLSKLPSLDSIGANSDITAFLQPGVPSDLKHAALRRAWVADPTIRDFIGPAENAWDFTDPNAMHGFGELDPHYDIKKLVAEVFRDAIPETETPPQSTAPAPALEQSALSPEKSDIAVNVPAAGDAAAPQQLAAAGPEDNLLRCDKNTATQQDNSTPQSAVPSSRRHGGALPE